VSRVISGLGNGEVVNRGPVPAEPRAFARVSKGIGVDCFLSPARTRSNSLWLLVQRKRSVNPTRNVFPPRL
jgi:hypothetical protein